MIEILDMCSLYGLSVKEDTVIVFDISKDPRTKEEKCYFISDGVNEDDYYPVQFNDIENIPTHIQYISEIFKDHIKQYNRQDKLNTLINEQE